MILIIFCPTISLMCIPYLEAATVTGKFLYQGNVSYFDKSLLISELRPTISDISLRYGSVECIKNLNCNAVEICTSMGRSIFRLSTSISKSFLSGSNTCFRYELEHTCERDSFYNRSTGYCQCVTDCDCESVTPSTGEILSHRIKLEGHVFTANCLDRNGHGWTMIQRRMDGSVNFFRGWTEYKTGFGDVKSEFWIGLDNIRLFVTNGYTVLRVELEYGTESVYAEYSSFYIAGEGDNYRIHVSGYSGTAGDGIACTTIHCNNDAQFSTYDNDNDAVSFKNHAEEWRGAWWYHDGHRSNLNGEYGNNNHGQGVNWFYFKGWTVSLTGTRMMLRRA